MDVQLKPKNVHYTNQIEASPLDLNDVFLEKSARPKGKKKVDFPQKRRNLMTIVSGKRKLSKREISGTFETKSQKCSRPRKGTFNDEIGLSSSIESDVNYTLSFISPNKDRRTMQDLLIRNQNDKTGLELVSEHISDDVNSKDDEDSLKKDIDLVVAELPNVDSDDSSVVLISPPPSPHGAQRASESLSKTDEDSLKKDIDLVVAELPDVDSDDSSVVLLSLPPSPHGVLRANESLSKTDEDSLKKDIDLVVVDLPDVESDGISVLTSLPPSPPYRRVQRANESLSKIVEDALPKAQMAPLSMMQDFKLLRNIFPDQSPWKILDLIKLHEVDKDRLQIVSNALCEGTQGDVTKNETTLTPAFDSMLHCSSAEDKKNWNQTSDAMNADFRTDYQDVMEVDLSETQSSPKKRSTYTKKVFMDGFTLEEFIEKYPNPDKTFRLETDEVSKLYQRHAIFALQIAFPFLETEYLELILDKHNRHLYPSYLEVITAKEKSYSLHPKVDISLTPFSSEPDERLFDEWWYIHNEQKVTEYLSMKEINQLMKQNEPEKKQQFFQCCCCFMEEYIFEDLLSCPEGHLFCKLCLLKSVEAAFGDGKTKFPCLSEQCDKVLPLSTLESSLPSKLFAKIEHHIQMEEIRQAKIPDLVTCPFCPFAVIMPSPKDKVFKCLNPVCLKESCRLCHKQHDKFVKCEKEMPERKSQTVIDNKMTETVTEKCHKCGRRFIKEIGCNKMTCICGGTSCYVCKKKDVGYDHFGGKNRCDLFGKSTVIRQWDLEDVALESTIKARANPSKDVIPYLSSVSDFKSEARTVVDE